MPGEPTVFVVDDDDAMRESLRFLIRSVGLEIASFDSAEAFLDAYDGARPACLILDLRMPGMSGLELQEELASRGFDIPIVFLTAYGDVPTTARAFRSGAVDFLEKPTSGQALLERIREVLAIDSATHRDRVESQDARDRLAQLTAREREVGALIAEGATSKEIAARLDLSVYTVQNHRAGIMRKLGVSSGAALATLFTTAARRN